MAGLVVLTIAVSQDESHVIVEPPEDESVDSATGYGVLLADAIRVVARAYEVEPSEIVEVIQHELEFGRVPMNFSRVNKVGEHN